MTDPVGPPTRPTPGGAGVVVRAALVALLAAGAALAATWSEDAATTADVEKIRAQASESVTTTTPNRTPTPSTSTKASTTSSTVPKATTPLRTTTTVASASRACAALDDSELANRVPCTGSADIDAGSEPDCWWDGMTPRTQVEVSALASCRGNAEGTTGVGGSAGGEVTKVGLCADLEATDLKGRYPCIGQGDNPTSPDDVTFCWDLTPAQIDGGRDCVANNVDEQVGGA